MSQKLYLFIYKKVSSGMLRSLKLMQQDFVMARLGLGIGLDYVAKTMWTLLFIGRFSYFSHVANRCMK